MHVDPEISWTKLDKGVATSRRVWDPFSSHIGVLAIETSQVQREFCAQHELDAQPLGETPDGPMRNSNNKPAPSWGLLGYSIAWVYLGLPWSSLPIRIAIWLGLFWGLPHVHFESGQDGKVKWAPTLNSHGIPPDLTIVMCMQDGMNLFHVAQMWRMHCFHWAKSKAAREFQNDGLLSPGRHLACTQRESLGNGQWAARINFAASVFVLDIFWHPL